MRNKHYIFLYNDKYTFIYKSDVCELYKMNKHISSYNMRHVCIMVYLHKRQSFIINSVN